MEQVKTLVRNTNHEAYNLSAQMIELKVVQGAVAQLIDRLDEIEYKGWLKEHGAAILTFGEIRDTVRLIDMGFYPLYTKMQEAVNALNESSSELFDMIVKGLSTKEPDQNKKATATTVTNENIANSI